MIARLDKILGTSGLGKATLLALAAHKPEAILFTGRNTANGEQVVKDVKAISSTIDVLHLPCDQSDLHSVDAAMKRLLEHVQRLDIVICNAGVMGKDAVLTKDGYEYHFGVNHLAHGLIIKQLLPLLKSTANRYGDARVVSVASNGFRWTPGGGIVFEELQTTQDMAFAGRWRRYGQSKLANVVYAAELTRRHPEISSVSIHPGVIFTDLWDPNLSLLNRVFVWLATLGQSVSVEQGILNPCWAATTSKENFKAGAYYEPVGVEGAQTKDSSNEKLKQQLWNWTEEQLKTYS